MSYCTADLVKNRQKKKNIPNNALIYFKIDKTTSIVRKEKVVDQDALFVFLNDGKVAGI